MSGIIGRIFSPNRTPRASRTPDPEGNTSRNGDNNDVDHRTVYFDQNQQHDDDSSGSETEGVANNANNAGTDGGANDDRPLMGVTKISNSGHLGAYVGGKPLPDWSGLDPSVPNKIAPNKYRGESHKEAKNYYYRTKGLDKKIGPKDDLRETCRNVFKHLVSYGLDTISYLPDPANDTVMESVTEKPNLFSKEYVLTKLPLYTALWDHFDDHNNECATEFFLNSLGDELLRKVRDSLASTPHPSFILYWMTFVELNRYISVGRVDGLQQQIEDRKPQLIAGQNLEEMAALNIRDALDLEQAGWYNLSTGSKMVRNFASANPECPAFSNFAYSYMGKYEDAVTACFYMNPDKKKAYMDSLGFGYEAVCNKFGDYYRKANQDNHWLPSKTKGDPNALPKNFANQAKLKALNLIQNSHNGGNGKAPSGTCNACGKEGHWARNCPTNKTTGNDAATAKTSNRTNKHKQKKGGNDTTPWTKVPPANGASQTMEKYDKPWHWCAICKRWTASHGTAEHKTDVSSIAPSSRTKSNVSLMATFPNISAWHVSINDVDVKAKENSWLAMISTFMSMFIQLLNLLATVTIGIVMSVIGFMMFLSILSVLGHGIIAPLTWIATMLLFFYIHPIVSYIEPSEPPPPLLRWQTRQIKKWIKQNRKELANIHPKKRSKAKFHRSYPLRHRSNNNYYSRNELVERQRIAALQRTDMIRNVQIMEDRMEKLFLDNKRLIAANKKLTAELAASQLYNPTPFERENETPAEKELKIQKALADIGNDFTIIRGGISGFNNINRCCTYIATHTRPFLNMFQAFIPTGTSATFITKANAPSGPKTVIWDSGSSLSITNDRSEFIDGEFESVPSDRTITGISDTKVKIQGVGIVSWHFEDTKGFIRCLEVPCLYVPSIEQRLLSTTSLLKEYPNETISISDGKFMLSGSVESNTTPIEAYIDTNNNLPTSELCDPKIFHEVMADIQAHTTVVEEANRNLSEPEKELLKWHQRLGHIDCNKVKFLFRTGVLAQGEANRTIQTAAAKLRVNPRCAACLFGKQCQLSTPTTTKSTVTDSVGSISKDIIRPGQQVCIDHFVCKNKGRLFTSRGKSVPEDMYGGGCIFVDSYSGYVQVELQKHLNTLETIQAKERFEATALDYGVIPQTYLSDNGSAFTSHEFTNKMKEFAQVSKFAGAGAHHHNGVAERNIRTIISMARTMMIHSALHWPAVSDVELWPMAVHLAVHIFNRVPAIDTGICPLDKFTRQRFQQSKFHDIHVWGCPVYVLDKRTADGIKIPKWAPRSNRYIYMGASAKHSSTVPLVLNPESGVISPQFHVVIDEWFATIASSTGEAVDFNDEKWIKMFGENERHYLWNDEEEQDEENVPPPQYENVERREQRIVTALDHGRPPTPLPMVDPPNTPTFPTPFQTPNRFEPLASFDDDDMAPYVTIDTQRSTTPTTPIQAEMLEQRESPVRIEESRASVSNIIEPTVNDQVQEGPTLRRSTRERRAPDRMNLYNESGSCFFVNKETYGMNSVDESVFAYLVDALCATTPSIIPAFNFGSADAFKASIGDPDTLTWDQAMNDIEHLDEWMAAALKEISSLEKHGTWVVDQITNATSKVLPGTWVFRRKRAPDGTILKYKARYCVRGDLQTDHHETYAPVVGWSTIRLFLILSMYLHWETKSIDFSQAFVQAMLDYPVWIHLPRGFHTNNTGENKACLKLVKSLYGLAEAPRLWYLHLFDALVNKLGFVQSKIDACLLMKSGIMIVVFVDDCAISYRTIADYNKLITGLTALGFEFTEEGDFSKFLGISFDNNNKTIHMTQTGLIDRIAAATGLTDSNPNHTPTHQEALGKDINGPAMTDTWSYRSVVGMLLYLSTNTRPDIAFAVSQVARFSNDPKKSHAIAVKTIIRYLVGTRKQGTVVTPTGTLDIKLYVDADFAGLFKKESESDPDSARSRTGYILLLGGFPLIWKSSLQTKIALSTLEAEYSALSAATRALIPIRELLFEIAATVALPKSLLTTIRSTVFEDNQGAYLLATTQRISARTRYFTVEFHHFWEFVKLENDDMRKIFIEKVATEHQGADFLTKGLAKIIYHRNRFIILGW